MQPTVSLIHGECLEELHRLPACSVDAVVTDPPYILAAGSNGNMGGKVGTWGDMMNAAYWYATWYAECWRVLRPHGSFWTFCNWRSLPVVHKALFDARIPATSLVVWDKEWIGPGGPQSLRPTYELISMSGKEEARIPNRSLSDLWRCRWMARQKSQYSHPAEKPVALLEMTLQATGIQAGTVLDPFMGSGSTGEAAIRLGWSFVGIEIDDVHFATAHKRLAECGSQAYLPTLEKGNGEWTTR